VSTDGAATQDTVALQQLQSIPAQLRVGAPKIRTITARFAAIASKPRQTGSSAHRQSVGWSVYSGAINAYTKDFAMKRLISSLAALLAVACLVTACGQKGPLYLPDDDASNASSPEAKTHPAPHKHTTN
jgi:predicted small lipoprotein YifL